MPTPPFVYQDPLPLGDDDTVYRLLSKEGISAATFEGREILKVSPETIAFLTQQAFHDCSFMLRSKHLQQVAAILDDLGAQSADVFGSSGGAVTGLALVSAHPPRVRTLIAHEPPVLELLPDAAEQRAKTEEIVETFHRDGVAAAMAKFMANAGFDVNPEGAPVAAEPSPQQIAHGTRFLAHELSGTASYVPDIAALTRGPARVIVGIGADSGGLLTYRTSTALADQLGSPPVEFPGDHGGFIGQPAEFADTLRKVLAET